MNFIKKISLLLAVLMLISCIAACEPSESEYEETSSETNQTEADSTARESASASESATETETETATETVTETETETETVTETESEECVLAEDFVSFCDYTATTRSSANFKDGKEYAVYFEIPEGAQMKSFYLQFVAGSDNNANIDLVLYKVDKLGSSAKTLPDLGDAKVVFTDWVSEITYNTHSVYFKDGEIGEGCYILKVKSDDKKGEYNDTIFVGKAWIGDLPDGYEDYSIKTFIDGAAQKKHGLYGGFVIEHNVPVSKIGELHEEEITEKDEGDKIAKVILLSGQSNATGATPYAPLANHVSEEKYQEYLNGYSNVKILYQSGASGSAGISIPNKSETFVDTKLGQGHVTSYLGPEVGLAEYLSKKYPDETFYIIKYAIGGVSLNGYFNPYDDEKDACLEALYDLVYDGLGQLEDEGLEPKIVAFLWMQGESDAGTINGTYSYYDKQKDMVALVRDEFADYASVRGIAFIDAGISDHGYWAGHMVMNAMKKKFSYESLANYYIDTVGEGLVTLTEDENTDHAHYVTTSVIKLGQLFGEKVAEHID